MHPQTAPVTRMSVGGVLVLISGVLWVVTFAWMWLPVYVFRVGGQLYLFPLAVLAEAVVVVLAIIAAVFAIVDFARRRIRVQAVLVLVGSVLMLTVGPLLLWFGAIPVGANLVG